LARSTGLAVIGCEPSRLLALCWCVMRASAIVLVLCGCGRLGFDPVSEIDAAPPIARCDPARPFGAVIPLPQLSSPQAEIGVELADDGLTGFLWSDRTGIDQIYETSRATLDDALGAPRLVTALMTPGAADRDPCPSGDGLSIVFTSLRPGGGGGDWDLWVSRRASRAAAFDAPSPLTASNDGAANWGPYLTSSGRALYYVVGTDLVVARRDTVNGQFGPATVLGELNTPDAEFEPAVTPDELTIFFASNRPDGKGGLDIYTAKRTSTAGSFGAPVGVDELNTGDDDIPSWISADLCEIHLTRTNGSNGWDLYYARRPL
jgi:hypothetical protein